MRQVFYDQTEKGLELITNILDKWCVPYKIETKRIDGFFMQQTKYDVVVDVSYEFYAKLKQEYDEYLDNCQNLENCWNMPAYKGEEVNTEETHTPKDTSCMSKDMQSIGDILNDCLNKALAKEHSESFFNKLLKQLNTTGTRISFDDLNETEKLALTSSYPESVLRASTTIITRTPMGLAVAIKGD